MGRWTRRDPLGYVDGMGLYEYVQGHVLIRRDPTGLDDCQLELDAWRAAYAWLIAADLAYVASLFSGGGWLVSGPLYVALLAARNAVENAQAAYDACGANLPPIVKPGVQIPVVLPKVITDGPDSQILCPLEGGGPSRHGPGNFGMDCFADYMQNLQNCESCYGDSSGGLQRSKLIDCRNRAMQIHSDCNDVMGQWPASTTVIATM